MISVAIDYASPSVFESNRDRALLGIAANARRPVRFAGKVVQHLFPLRIALRALGQAIWSDDTWLSTGERLWILDPVITVHPDRLFFEAFSQDQSVYALLIVDPAIFETQGEVRTGTTNIDFTAWLWGALGEMRTSRDTTFRVGAEGFEVTTAGAGGRFEKKVELPEEWVRGFLQLQGAMAAPGTRLTVRPVDLLSAIRYLQFTKAKVSPRALRYEFPPGEEARLMLEPWEHAVPLKGSEHHYDEMRVIRTWGRRRLKLIEPLLPFAESVDIYLKGRALPSFYSVKLPGMRFVLGLSGWSGQKWTESASFDLSTTTAQNPQRLSAAITLLGQRYVMGVEEVAEALGIAKPEAESILVRLCRQGRAIFDVEARKYRHRELFEQPVDEFKLYPPDPRKERAAELVMTGQVDVASCEVGETVKTKRMKTPEGPVIRQVVYHDWRVRGRAGDQLQLEIVLNDSGRLIFGTCGCGFFKENLLNKGPCEHMVAMLLASEPLRRDLPSSRASLVEPVPRPVRSAATDEGDEKPKDDDVLDTGRRDGDNDR